MRPTFTQFWDRFPRKVGKQQARIVFELMAETMPADILAAVDRYAVEVTTYAPRFICPPDRWLSQCRWRPTVFTVDNRFTDSAWRDALRFWIKTRHWPSTLGAPPGFPGCGVPARIASEFGLGLLRASGRNRSRSEPGPGRIIEFMDTYARAREAGP